MNIEPELDFYASDKYREWRKGKSRRVYFLRDKKRKIPAGCRLIPEAHQYAVLNNGETVEFDSMQPKGRNITDIPLSKWFDDIVFLGSGVFSHYGKILE